MQGARILRNEAYLSYVGMTKDEAQRRRWTFCEAVKREAEQMGMDQDEQQGRNGTPFLGAMMNIVKDLPLQSADLSQRHLGKRRFGHQLHHLVENRDSFFRSVNLKISTP